MSVEETPSLPLGGITVLDFSHWWAGPMATRILGGLGARIIKVESPGRPDPMRFPDDTDVLERYPDRDPGVDPINRNAFFNTHNVDKLSVVIDIKHDDGLAIIRHLVEASDVFLANFRPGVLERLGLGYRVLSEWNPQLVYVEMPGYGNTGPLAKMPAYGSQFDAASGSAWAVGGSDEPLMTGFALADSASGLCTSGAVMSALFQRRRTGRGSHVELASRDAMMPLLGENILAHTLGVPIPYGRNGDAGVAPHGVYRAAEGFVALAVHSDEQWTALAEEIHLPAELREAMGTTRERLAHSDAIDHAVSAAVAEIANAGVLVERLQAVGVAAARVQNAESVSLDPQLAATGYFRQTSHASIGAHLYPGLPLRMDGERVGNRWGAPVFGADTICVLRDVLGYPDDQIDRYVASGIIETAETS